MTMAVMKVGGLPCSGASERAANIDGIDARRQAVLSKRLRLYLTRSHYGGVAFGDSTDLELIDRGLLLYKVERRDRGDNTELRWHGALVSEAGSAWLTAVNAQTPSAAKHVCRTTR